MAWVKRADVISSCAPVCIGNVDATMEFQSMQLRSDGARSITFSGTSRGEVGFSPDTTTYHHIVAVFYDEGPHGHAALYWDGELAADGTEWTIDATVNDQIRIGETVSDGYTDLMNGYIAHVAVWSTALDATEIADLYDLTVSPLDVHPESLVTYTPLRSDIIDDKLIVGFNQKVDKESYLKHFNNNTLPEILNFEKVKKGDTYFIPAGKIHAIGAGILLTEIQQTSDATYRIFDWNRTDAQGNPRELHTELALEAIDFNYDNDHKIKTEAVKNKTTNLVDCSYFFTNILKFDKPIEKDYNLIDSFVIYIATEGSFQISYENKITKVQMGECVLIPAVLKNLILEPNGYAELIEVYVK